MIVVLFPAPVFLGYPVLYFKLSEKVIASKRDRVKVRKIILNPKNIYTQTHTSAQSLLNIHLPAAPSESASRAIIRVYYLSQDKGGKTTLAPAKENKVQLRTDAGGRVEVNLSHLTRWCLAILTSM